MASIGALRYDIIADTSRFTRSMKMTKRELNGLVKTFGASQVKVRQHSKAMDALRTHFVQGRIDKSKYRQMVAGVNKSYEQQLTLLRKLKPEIDAYAAAERKASREQKKRLAGFANRAGRGAAGGGGFGTGMLAGRLTGGMGAAGLARLGGVGIAIGGITKTLRDGIPAMMEMERALVDFQVIAGDERTGKALFERLREIARETPLTLNQLTRGSQTLMQFGIDAEDTADAMERLGTIAGGDAERLQSLARAYGQVKSATRLMGQESIQFINAGFSPLQEIAEQTGVSTARLRKEMEKGNISFDMVRRAIISATEAGGRFNGRMEEMARTTSGKLTILSGKWQEFSASTGKFFQLPINAVTDLTSVTLSGMTKMMDATTGLFESTTPEVERATLAVERLAERSKKAAEEQDKMREKMARFEKFHKPAREQRSQEQQSFRERIDQLRWELSELKNGKEEVERVKIMQADVSDSLKEQLLTLIKMTRERKQQIADEEKLRRSNIEGEIDRLEEQRNRVRERMDQKVDIASTPNAPGALRGSREEFQLLRELRTDRQDQRMRQKAEERQAKLQEKGNATLKRLDEAIRKLEAKLQIAESVG